MDGIENGQHKCSWRKNITMLKVAYKQKQPKQQPSPEVIALAERLVAKWHRRNYKKAKKEYYEELKQMGSPTSKTKLDNLYSEQELLRVGQYLPNASCCIYDHLLLILFL